MSFLAIGVALLVLVPAFRAENLFDTQFHSLGRNEIPFGHILESRQLIKESALADDVKHHKAIFAAIHSKTPNFMVQEKANAKQVRRLSDVHGDAKGAVYDTRTSYSLKDNIHSLDQLHPEHLTELSDHHLRHCHRTPSTTLDAQAGHFVVGSHAGKWYSASHLHEWTSSNSRLGMVFGRRIVRRLDESDGCVTLHTEPILYLELLE